MKKKNYTRNSDEYANNYANCIMRALAKQEEDLANRYKSTDEYIDIVEGELSAQHSIEKFGVLNGLSAKTYTSHGSYYHKYN